MEHVNKQLGGNLGLFEQRNSDPKPKPFMEGLNIAILILLGSGGLYIYCNIMSPKEPPINFSGITTNTVIIKPQKEHREKERETGVQKEQLVIKGHQEAGEKITVTIDNFDVKARYTIDFGDGHTRAAMNNSIAHIYRKPGNYKLLLKIGYENEPVQHVSKEIYIDQPIEVDSDAYYEK
ncbi:MAG: hypothetical protein ACI8P3_003537 [Saprospiraceae bacterium]|jgi:hypothetical protein